MFRRFSRLDEAVHVIVSCRTISVGVDLPTCDAVVFADTTHNITEIVQRGCRPLRLTDEERRTGEFEKAKIFFPINISAAEVHGVLEATKKDEKIHQTIRGNPLEIPMLVLNMLKEGLDIDFSFHRTGNEEMGAKETDEEDNGDNTNDGKIEKTSKRQTVNVDISFPFSDYMWEESRKDFAKTFNNLCVSSKKKPCVIKGWEGMSETERATYIADWSDRNEGQRPKQKGGKGKDEAQKVMASWLGDKLTRRTGYERCMREEYAPLRRHTWWNDAVESLLQEKEPCVEGWKGMTERERATFVADWSDRNGGQRPKRGGGKEKDETQEVMATWLSNRLKKGQTGYERCMGADYTSLRRHAWWNDAVASLLQKKEPCVIKGWETMTERDKASFIADWSDRNRGQRPKHQKGREVKDETQKIMATWLSERLKKGQKNYERCKQEDYASLSRQAWWNDAVKSLLQESEPCVIEGWEDMTERERATYIADWSDRNKGQRPKRGGGKDKDGMQKVMATWLGGRLKKGQKNYERCKQEDYASLSRHAWWKDAVGSLLKEKEPCIINGWEGMTERDKATYIADWSDRNGGQRPKDKGGKDKDEAQKVMATWLRARLKKGQKNYERCKQEDYASLSRQAWWNDAVESLLQESEPCVIEGWEGMTETERATIIADWSDGNGGRRPKHKGGKDKDETQKVMASWLNHRLKRRQAGYERCMGEVYAPLRKYAWWNDSVASLLQEKEPRAIEGWEGMSEREKATFIAEWSDGNGGRRPKFRGGKDKDEAQKIMTNWLSGRLKKGQIGYERCMEDVYGPLRKYAWWNDSIASLLREKEPCVIEGWEEMTERDKATFIAEWSDRNGGQRPKQGGGKDKDDAQKVMATWLGGRLKKGQIGYERCKQEDYASLSRQAWWNDAVESLLQESEPCAIEGWEEMTKREKATFIANWSDRNGGQRPKTRGGKDKDETQKVMASWLNHRLKKGQTGYERCMEEVYGPLRKYAWWNDSVASLLKEPCVIEGWEEMTERDKATFIADWSDRNGVQRPKREGGKDKDEAQKVMANWLSYRLKRGQTGYERCMGEDYAPLGRHAWWNESVQNLLD